MNQLEQDFAQSLMTLLKRYNIRVFRMDEGFLFMNGESNKEKEIYLTADEILLETD